MFLLSEVSLLAGWISLLEAAELKRGQGASLSAPLIPQSLLLLFLVPGVRISATKRLKKTVILSSWVIKLGVAVRSLNPYKKHDRPAEARP